MVCRGYHVFHRRIVDSQPSWERCATNCRTPGSFPAKVSEHTNVGELG
jgi:hypothetical protein